jgi:DNA-binding SARP family transcriptional activator
LGRALIAVGRDAMVRTGSLTIQLLGRLEIRAGGTPIRVTGRHAQALFGLLAIHPRLRLRDTIAAEIWPEADGPSASSLRQALWLIRSGFSSAGLAADDWIETDQDSLGLRRDIILDVDTDRFGRLAAAPCPEDAEAALGIYAGDLLEGLGHECFAAERERLSDLYEDLLAAVAQQRLDREDLAGARLAATELLGRDPLREEAHAVLIALYGRTGSRSQIVRQYRRLCGILRSELSVTPLPETDATYRVALARANARSHERVAELGYAARRQSAFERLLIPSA